jgi:hypothetical protein
MTDMILMALVFTCGVFVGLIVGAFVAASRDDEEIDGRVEHDRPVRSAFWSRDSSGKEN